MGDDTLVVSNSCTEYLQLELQSMSIEVIKLMSGLSSVAIPPLYLPSVRGLCISR